MQKNLLILLSVLFAFTGLYAQQDFTQQGVASFYADKFQGRKTASGTRFSQQQMTCAHRFLPFGTKVKVTNIKNGKSVELTVTDRGPFTKGRIIDVTKSAARQLDFICEGKIEVALEVIPDVQDNLESDAEMAQLKPGIYRPQPEPNYAVRMPLIQSERSMLQAVRLLHESAQLPVYVFEQCDSNRTWYQLYVGRYFRKEDAEDFIEQLTPYYPEVELAEWAAETPVTYLIQDIR